MKNLLNLLCAGVLGGILCAGFVACNDEAGRGSGLGKEIPGMENFQATGTVIGSYTHGFGSYLVQVDEEFSIGGSILYESRDEGPWTPLYLPETGTYHNVIQVQHRLPITVGNTISFSVREFQGESDKDGDLFIFGNGTSQALYAPPDLPIFVITDLQLLNN